MNGSTLITPLLLRRLALITVLGTTAFMLAALAGAGTSARAAGSGPLIVGNNARTGGGPIQTYDFSSGGAPVASFVPSGAFDSNNGRGVEVVGNEVFYTELSGGFGPSDFIRVAPYNNGSGGPDTRTLPNPAPGKGIADLAYANGALYAMTGYPLSPPLQVWKLDPASGAALAAPVPILTPGGTTADGFTVLPDGNFLINDGDANCTYREYNPSTGLPTGSSFTLPFSACTGVDTDGTFLYFSTDFNSFTKTDLAGHVVSTTPVTGEDVGIEDVSLLQAGAPAHLTLAPKTASNPVGTQHCVTATVTDASGTATPGITVQFSVTGSVTTSGSGTTDANGHATFCYTGPALPGADVITAFADTNNNTTQDSGEPGDTATKAWVLPASTPGCKVSDGGRITAANGDKATFGGAANVAADGTSSGSQEYQDHGPAANLNVHSTAVLAVVCTGNSASIFGTATINGAGSFDYRIDVTDNGEPGAGADTYRIRLSTGYDSGAQILSGGNIQLH